MTARRKHGESEVARRDGGLCAAFVNSASKKRRGFSTYSEILAWALRCGAVDAGHAERLERAAAEHPRAAAAVAVRVLEARSLLARIFAARVERREPAAEDLEAFNAELSRALPARRLILGPRQLEWSWGDRGGDDFDRVLWPILWSAADVFTSKYYFKIGRCAGEGCDLIFVDRTPGSPRRWCNKQACGHKINARRHYERFVKPEIESRRKGTKLDPKFLERRLDSLAGRRGDKDEPPP